MSRRFRGTLEDDQTTFLGGHWHGTNIVLVAAITTVRLVAAEGTVRTGPFGALSDFSVPMVLDLIGRSARQKLSDFRPTNEVRNSRQLTVHTDYQVHGGSSILSSTLRQLACP